MTKYSPAAAAGHWNAQNARCNCWPASACPRSGCATRIWSPRRRRPWPGSPTSPASQAGVRPVRLPRRRCGHALGGPACRHTASGNPMRFTTGRITIRRDERWRTAMPVSPAPHRHRADGPAAAPVRLPAAGGMSGRCWPSVGVVAADPRPPEPSCARRWPRSSARTTPARSRPSWCTTTASPTRACADDAAGPGGGQLPDSRPGRGPEHRDPGLDTDLVAFCDDDDEWLPGKLARAGHRAAGRPGGAEFAELRDRRRVTAASRPPASPARAR